jgi:DNA-binding CsgD family transcriptional regulator
MTYLPDMPDVHYAFLRTDDAAKLEPVPAHVRDGVVIEVDVKRSRVLVADPVTTEAQWLSTKDIPYAADRARLGENVYLAEQRGPDGRPHTLIRSQNRGLWTDAPPPLKSGRALDPSTLSAAQGLTPNQQRVVDRLAAGHNYAEIAAQLADQIAPGSISVTVSSALRRLGIDPPSSGADLIVAAHNLGLVQAEPKTLERATLIVRLREELGLQLNATEGGARSLDVLEALARGESDQAVMAQLGMDRAGLRGHVQFWQKKFKLEPSGNFNDNAERVLQFAAEHGYIERAPNTSRVQPQPAPRQALPPGRALDPTTLNPTPRFTPFQRLLAERLAAGQNYAQMSAQLPGQPSERTLAVMVSTMLREMNIDAPSTAADLIVALDAKDVAKANPQTLERATRLIRLRENLGTQMWGTGDSRSNDLLEAWNRGVNRATLMTHYSLDKFGLHSHVNAWLKRFGLKSLGSYELNVGQIVLYAREHGYIDAPPKQP